MRVGIEKINLYGGRAYLNIADLATARGGTLHDLTRRQMVPYEGRAILPPYEDPVTLAVNATERLLAAEDREQVELVVVATESAVDFGKPISTWVQRFCGLPANSRNFEVKHMCYGGTAALRVAASWVASNVRPGKKALVVNSDLSRTRNHVQTEEDDLGELMAGGSAVAMLVSDEPQVLELELAKAGYWTNEISDALRPNSRTEIITGQTSFYSYLDALEETYEAYEGAVGELDFESYFKKNIYHAPFPGMTMVAHRTLLNKIGIEDKAAIEASYRARVADSTYFIRRIGSAYGGSTFICLLGMLHAATDLAGGDRLSIFAYGSGCQAELYSGLVGPAAQAYVRGLDIDQHLDSRVALTVEQYEQIEKACETNIDVRTYESLSQDVGDLYAQRYEGQRLLVLEDVRDYHRNYRWS
ncbi:MAG TPA: hydroxymethylglutaryl-CoA synthase [Micromonosporaceae bacterium]|nr:hydroxymethylglutaryl-CoA synthase [Micromonosporaceae bacterium]